MKLSEFWDEAAADRSGLADSLTLVEWTEQSGSTWQESRGQKASVSYSPAEQTDNGPLDSLICGHVSDTAQDSKVECIQSSLVM